MFGVMGVGGANAPTTAAMYALLAINPLTEAGSPSLKTLLAAEAKVRSVRC